MKRTNTTILSIRSHLSRAAPLLAANVIANETSYFPPPHFFGEPSFHRDGNAQGDLCTVPRDSLGKPSSLVSGYTNADGGAQILTKIIDLFRDTVPKSCFTKYIRPSIMQNVIISTKKRQSIEVNHNRFVQ